MHPEINTTQNLCSTSALNPLTPPPPHPTPSPSQPHLTTTTTLKNPLPRSKGNLPGRPQGGRHGMVFGQIPVSTTAHSSNVPVHLVPGRRHTHTHKHCSRISQNLLCYCSLVSCPQCRLPVSFCFILISFCPVIRNARAAAELHDSFASDDDGASPL